MPKYIVVCHIKVDEEDPEIYDTILDAELDCTQLEEMYPENIYTIEDA